jgi:hypothetical protein
MPARLIIICPIGPPRGIIDPGYNAGKPSRFVYEMSLNTSPYV